MFKFAKFRGHDSLVRRPDFNFDELANAAEGTEVSSAMRVQVAEYVYNGGSDRAPREFDVKYCGGLIDLVLLKPSICMRDEELQLADVVQQKQLQGDLSISPSNLPPSKLIISKQSIKIMLNANSVCRIPWHQMISAVSFINFNGAALVLITVAQPFASDNPAKATFDCHVLQCRHAEQAQQIMQSIKSDLDALSAALPHVSNDYERTSL